MEKAYFFSSPPASKDIPQDTERMYFGNEFCEYLIPGEEALIAALEASGSNDQPFTFVTAYAGDKILSGYTSLIKRISEIRPGSEVVINDWGVLKTVQKFGLEPVVGRLLVKQKRDPRIAKYIDNLPARFAEALKTARINEEMVAFYREEGIRRIEIDNLLQGIDYEELMRSGLSVTLHSPYGYIATGRICSLRNSSGGYKHFSIGSCPGYCRKSQPQKLLSDKGDLGIIIKGNTAYFFNDEYSEALKYAQPDRILIHKDFPL